MHFMSSIMQQFQLSLYTIHYIICIQFYLYVKMQTKIQKPLTKYINKILGKHYT